MRLLWLLCVALTSVVAQNARYCAVGGDLTLKPKSPPAPIERVVWKHGVNLLADVTRGRFNSYGQFKCCTTLETDGTLTIKDIQRVHAGEYSVEVNNQVQDQKYDVRVINKLARPIVRAAPLTCSYTSESCVLVCVVDTTDAGPVSYTWFFGTEQSEVSLNELKIEHSSDPPPTYACQVKNPVSEADSEALENPLIPPPPPPPYWVAAVVFVLLVIIVLGILACWKKEVIRDRIRRVRGVGQANNSNSNHPAPTQPPETQPFDPNGSSAEKTAQPGEDDDHTTL